MNLNTVPKMGLPGGPILGPHPQLNKRTKEKHFHGPIFGAVMAVPKIKAAKSQNPNKNTTAFI